MLFAPKSGKELRRDIADASRRTYDKGTETARRVGDRLSHGADTVRGAVDRSKNQLQGAFEAGKQSFHEERERSET